MTLYKKLTYSGIVALAIVLSILMAHTTQQVFAGITQNNPAQKDTFVYHQFFSVATTTTATSTLGRVADQLVRIDGAKKVNLVYSRTGRNGNEGSSNFYPQVSYDGSTWFYFGKQLEYASTTQPALGITITLPNTVVSGTSTKSVGLDTQLFGFKYLRCVVVETTDGEHSCDAAVTY